MKISDQLKEVPAKPGIYMFYDETGSVLYVGKAINLRNRVRSYFSAAHSNRPWIAVMIDLIKRIETTIVTNELEALMLESTLIKQYLPKFNIKLTDDKTYPFIKLSRGELIPRFSIVRRRTSETDEHYFGPYLSARSAQFTLEFLRDLYGVHISDKPLQVNKTRACFHCQLTGHPCPCAGEISQEAYEERIDKATLFLRGKRKNILNDLLLEMERAAESKQFERAAKLRDLLHASQQITTPQSVISTHNEDYDAIGVFSSSTTAVICVTHIRDGRVSGQQHFFVENSSGEFNRKILRDFLTTMYPTLHTIPQLVAIPEELEDQQLIELLLSQQSGRRVELRTAERGEKLQMVRLSTRNAESKLQQRLINRDNAFEGLVALKELLELAAIPERIEAIDISNLGVSEPVGASVCFIHGQPEKNEYRRYLIKMRHYKKDKSLGQNNFELNECKTRNIRQAPNDFAMIREVVSRRLSDTSRPLPDLLVIDGGPEQLKFAVDAFNQSQRDSVRIISLAKKPDRIFIPGRKTPVPAKRLHKGVLLLARIRDEVHRYGLSFQRARQRKKSLNHSE